MFCTLLSTQAFAADLNPTTCANLTPIDQIKAYVTCQGAPGLAACGALGSTAAGFVASAYLKRRYVKMMETAHDQLAHNLAEAARDQDRAARLLLDPKARLAQLNDEVAHAAKFAKTRAAFDAAARADRVAFDPEATPDQISTVERNIENRRGATDALASAYRDHQNQPPSLGDRLREQKALELAIKKRPNGPVYEPLMRRPPFDLLMVYDIANLNYDDLPDSFRIDYEVRAKSAAALIRQGISNGVPLDRAFVEHVAKEVHSAWVKEARKRPREAGMELSDKAYFEPELEASRRMVHKAVADLKTAETSILAKGLGPAIRLARKLGPAGPLALGGIVGAGLYVAGKLSDSSDLACEGVERPYVNQDSSNSCAAKCEVDEKVANFLMKSPGEQRDLLVKFAGVCAYYSKLHQCFFARPKFEGLACASAGVNKSRVTIKARDAEGLPREYRVDVRDDGTVSAVGVYNAGGMKTRLFNFANADETPTTKLTADSGAARELKQLKLFIPSAVECCRENSEACAQEFGGAEKVLSPAGTPTAPAATPTAH